METIEEEHDDVMTNALWCCVTNTCITEAHKNDVNISLHLALLGTK